MSKTTKEKIKYDRSQFTREPLQSRYQRIRNHEVMMGRLQEVVESGHLHSVEAVLNLIEVMYFNDVSDLRKQLTRPRLLTLPDQYGHCAIHFAAKHGHVGLLRVFLPSLVMMVAAGHDRPWYGKMTFQQWFKTVGHVRFFGEDKFIECLEATDDNTIKDLFVKDRFSMDDLQCMVSGTMLDGGRHWKLGWKTTNADSRRILNRRNINYGPERLEDIGTMEDEVREEIKLYIQDEYIMDRKEASVETADRQEEEKTQDLEWRKDGDDDDDALELLAIEQAVLLSIADGTNGRFEYNEDDFPTLDALTAHDGTNQEGVSVVRVDHTPASNEQDTVSLTSWGFPDSTEDAVKKDNRNGDDESFSMVESIDCDVSAWSKVSKPPSVLSEFPLASYRDALADTVTLDDDGSDAKAPSATKTNTLRKMVRKMKVVEEDKEQTNEKTDSAKSDSGQYNDEREEFDDLFFYEGFKYGRGGKPSRMFKGNRKGHSIIRSWAYWDNGRQYIRKPSATSAGRRYY